MQKPTPKSVGFYFLKMFACYFAKVNKVIKFTEANY